MNLIFLAISWYLYFVFHWQALKQIKRVWWEAVTEQSELRVCTHPELSFWTQQPDSLSRFLAFWIRFTICLSWRMQGENFAPRWMRSSCNNKAIYVTSHIDVKFMLTLCLKEQNNLQYIRHMQHFSINIIFLRTAFLKERAKNVRLTFIGREATYQTEQRVTKKMVKGSQELSETAWQEMQ